MYAALFNRISSLPKLSKICNLLLLFSFLECVGGGIAYYLALYLGTSTSLTKLQIGQICSVVGLGSLVGALFATYITDRVSSKVIIILSFASLGLSFLSLPLSIDFITIAFCAVIIGIATNIFLTANNTLLLQNAPQDHISLRFAQSMKVVSENLGTSCSLLLIMFFAAQYYGQIFQGIGIFFLIFAFYTIKYLQIEKQQELPITSTESYEEQAPNNNLFYLMLVSVFIVGIIYAQQRVAYPLYLDEKFASFTITASLFWLDPFIVSLFQIKITEISSKLKIHHQLAIGGFLLGGGLFALIIVKTIIGTVVAFLIFILGEMLFMPACFLQCYQSASNKQKGMASGAWRTAYSSGLILGPLLSGFLMENYSYNACWILAGCLGLLISIIVLIRKNIFSHN